MNIKTVFIRLRVLIVASLLMSCGGDSNVGNQDDFDPIAIAAVFGATLNTEDSVSVRSGSEILLSGQNSDGLDDPLLEFQWTQINIGDYPVVLSERNSNSVAFNAPAIPATETDGITLEFQLDIIDADGKEASDTVQVNVLPVGDANHFLSRPKIEDQYVLIAAPATGVTLIEDVPITITISQTATWTDRSGVNREIGLTSKQLTGTVKPVGNLAITSQNQLYFLEQIPMLDADDVNTFFQAENRSGRLEFELVEGAELIISVALNTEAVDQVSLYLAKESMQGFALLDNESVTTATNQLVFTGDWLQQQVGVESRTSGQNYYTCIDPLGQATTLGTWLEQAGFNSGANDVVHTTYVNNFDLNFGRDMYLRKDDNENVYAYVTNYPTLESTLSGTNDFAVVAMEFSPAPTGSCGDGTFTENTGGKKIVKFYAFVPDETTGEYVRAPTMNFDGRGERALPGVCIACHFGDPSTSDFNAPDIRTVSAEAADLKSSFMIWDLDAFLYTKDDNEDQIDPIYAVNEISEEVTEQYSRQSQEASFREQNQAVLDTFIYDVNQMKRFETPIKLLHSLYGNGEAVENLNFGSEENPLSDEQLQTLKAQIATLPANNYDGLSYVQPGWEGQEELYHKVFARNCRLCHAQISEAVIDFDSYEEFVNNDRLVSYVFERGLMPLSRLTMDRFWNDFYGEQSAAEFLREHLNNDRIPGNDVAPELTPGAPVAVVSPEKNTETAADVIIDFDGSVLFDATTSLFADAYQWRVDDEFRTIESKFLYRAATPGDTSEISVVAINSETLVSSRQEKRSVLVRDNSPSIESVPSQTLVEGESITIDLYSVLCPAGQPDSLNCRSVFGDISAGETPTITIVGEPVNGNIINVDSASGAVVFNSTESEAAGDASFAFTLTDSFGEVSSVARAAISINSLSGPVIGGPDTCSVSARSYANVSQYPVVFGSTECPDPSLNDTVEGDLSLSIVGVDGSELRAGGSVVLNEGNIQFTPGRFFVGQESFTYTVQDSSLSAKTSQGTVLVNVGATQTYTSLISEGGVFETTGDTGCGECHDGNTAGAPNWFNIENVRLAATNDHTQPYQDPEITLAEPTTTAQLLNAIIFRNACNETGLHPGGNRLCVTAGAPQSVDDLNDFGRTILTWLEEGAQDN